MRYLPSPRRIAPRRAWAAAVLVISLIALSVAIPQALKERERERGKEPKRPARVAPRGHQSGDSWDYTSLALSVGFVVVGFGWLAGHRRRIRRFNEESGLALRLFNSGDYAAAASRFAALSRSYRRPRVLRATASFNLAMARLRIAEFDQVMELLSSIDAWLPYHAPRLGATVAVELAGLYALRGDTAAADLWLEAATERAKRVAPVRSINPMIAFTSAVNALRRDEPGAAAHILDAAWDDVEATVPAIELRPFRVLRAFAAARGGAPSPRASSASAAAALADVRAGELVRLGAEWPEMRAFLESAAAPQTR